jgi:TDG/mug DNA glycosylase family protein
MPNVKVRKPRARVSALPDRAGPGMRVLFVGINPGLRSAALGHHFAGPSNRFWKLLHESGLVSHPVTWRDDERMPSIGYGMTNLVPRATAGVQDLSLPELRAGRRALAAKVRRWRPEIVALVGVTVHRVLFDVRGVVVPGLTPETISGARVFVLPNPSGRNAHFSYGEMLAVYSALAALVQGIRPRIPPERS